MKYASLLQAISENSRCVSFFLITVQSPLTPNDDRFSLENIKFSGFKLSSSSIISVTNAILEFTSFQCVKRHINLKIIEITVFPNKAFGKSIVIPSYSSTLFVG